MRSVTVFPNDVSRLSSSSNAQLLAKEIVFFIRHLIFVIRVRLHVLLHIFRVMHACALETFLCLERNEGADRSEEFMVVIIEIVINLIVNFL